MMNYTVKDTRIFKVRNSATQTKASSTKAAATDEEAKADGAAQSDQPQ